MIVIPDQSHKPPDLLTEQEAIKWLRLGQPANNGKPVRAYWSDSPKPGNLGDVLTPWLIGQISGRQALRTQPSEGVVLCIGSIIREATAGAIVWGAGIMFPEDQIDPAADIRAVRGPLTRDTALARGAECPKTYGDPALLMPMFFSPRVEKQYRLGIVPHYADFEYACEQWSGVEDVSVVKILNKDPLEVVRHICQCDYIISSSLHGLILAQSYEIPALWVEFSDKVCGAGTKFRDYLLSTGQGLYQPIQLRRGRVDTNELIKSIPPSKIKINLQGLLAACPF